MKNPRFTDDNLLMDLLVERATEGLSDEREQRLNRRIKDYPDLVGSPVDEIALAAAEFDLALIDLSAAAAEPLPEDMRRRVMSDGELFFDRRGEQGRPSVSKRRWIDMSAAGWYAAAAMLALFMVLQLRPDARVEPQPPGPMKSRQELLATGQGVIRAAWAKPEDPRFSSVQGDVVWSTSEQTGFLRLAGMPSNRPEREQYQLWIVDPARDEQPIDGGVFDIPPGVDEVIIPIDAKLEVVDPKAFAITLERSGGVVVSDGPLLVVASVES